MAYIYLLRSGRYNISDSGAVASIAVMRSAFLAWLLVALFISPNLAVPRGLKQGKQVLAEEAVQGESSVQDVAEVEYTVFSGIQVPPMIEIQGDKFAETVKHGYWYARPYGYLCSSD